jgi:Chitin binding Peritrophin-A domain
MTNASFSFISQRRNLVLSETNVKPFETTHMDSRCAQKNTQVAQHLAHPTSCTKFFKCYLGEAFLEHCPSGLHFSVALDRCEDIEVANCQVDRWSHNMMQENEKKKKHKSKPQVSQAGSQYRPDSEQKLPLMSVALPPSVKQNTERPKDDRDYYNHKDDFGSDSVLEEYMDNFFNYLNSPNLFDHQRPIKDKPVKKDKVIDKMPIEKEWIKPLKPTMVVPPVPEHFDQNYELPIYKPIETVSVEPIPLQTVPILPKDPVRPPTDLSVDPVPPVQILPVLPIRPINPGHTNERPNKQKKPALPDQPNLYPGQPIPNLPVQPVDPVQTLPEQSVDPIQTLPEEPVNAIESLPEQPSTPIQPINPDQTKERPKKLKRPGKPKYEDFKNKQEYFDRLYEYYYPSQSNAVAFSSQGQRPGQRQPVAWQAPKRQNQLHRQAQRYGPGPNRQRGQHPNVQRPMYQKRYRDATNLGALDEGIPDGRCPWKDDPARPIHLAHPTDCTKFFKCFLGSVYEHDCPEGLEWSAKFSLCDHATTAECSASKPIIEIEPAQAFEDNDNDVGIPDPRCPRVEGKYAVHFEHPSECNKFYKCSFGLAYVINCPPGLHWSRQLNRCDFKHVALCPYRHQL